MYPNVEAYKQIMHKHVFTNIFKKKNQLKLKPIGNNDFLSGDN